MTLTLQPWQSNKTDAPVSPQQLVIAVGSLGDYRKQVVLELRRRLGESLIIIAGSPSYDRSIKLLDYSQFGVRHVKNNYYFGRHDILFQNLPWKTVLSAKSLVLDLNPRVAHNWALLIIRRVFGRPTFLWGHAWSRSGPKSKSEIARSLMRKLASGLITYTQQQASELRSLSGARNIFVAPNSLYSADKMGFETESPRFRLLYVGRLVQSKKAMLLIKAMSRIATRYPDVVLTIVGEGPLRSQLERTAEEELNANQFEFLGHVADYERIKGLYAETIVSVSPGYVGLSITQSLAFGVPMLIADAEPHSPEIEAAVPDFNARFFNSDSVASLAHELTRIIEDRLAWASQGGDIADDCKARYSSERMADGIIQALQS